jgi:hypothetical protein
LVLITRWATVGCLLKLEHVHPLANAVPDVMGHGSKETLKSQTDQGEGGGAMGAWETYWQKDILLFHFFCLGDPFLTSNWSPMAANLSHPDMPPFFTADFTEE